MDYPDAQTEVLLAGDEGDECSSFPNPAGKTRRRLGRRNAMCSVGIVTGGPTSTVRDASTFDLLYCPVVSLFIKWLFVCSSPEPRTTFVALGFSTLYESTRGKQKKNNPPFSLPSLSPLLFLHPQNLKHEQNGLVGGDICCNTQQFNLALLCRSIMIVSAN